MLRVQKILDEAEQRWERLAIRWPDLEATIAIQRRLVRRGLSLSEAVAQAIPARVQIEPGQLSPKLHTRTPAFIGEVIEVPGKGLGTFVVGFCEDLAIGDAGGPARRLGERLNQAEIDVGSLIAASLGRQQEAIRTKAHHIGVSPDLLWLVAELAAGPIAHRLQHELLVEDVVAHRAVSHWHQGFCPACGSWPALAERIRGEPTERRLRCSFCGAGWTPPASRCIYCEEQGDAFVTASPDPADASRHLEMCQQCGAYLKSTEVDAPIPFALLPVADLETSDLDLGASERGYGRPPMPDFNTENTLPCPPPQASS